MNWFTKTNMASASDDAKKAKVDNWGGCEHVEANNSLLHIVSYENDSFGKEGYCLCKECFEKSQAEVDDEIVTCVDCKLKFKKIDTIEWKWYDFYAAQGDEAICICKECKKLPNHKKRVEKDRADELDEFPEG